MGISSLTLVIASRLRLIWCISFNEKSDDIHACDIACINVRYFKSVFYGHGNIRLKGTFLGKRINIDLIDMREKKSKFWFTPVAYIHRPGSSRLKELEMI